MKQKIFSKMAIRYLSATLVLAMLLVPVSISPAVAQADYDIWTKPEIPQLLTKGTASFDDDNAIDLVHEIQWDETPWLDEATWRDEVDGILDVANGTIEVDEVFEWVVTDINYVEDEVNYGIPEAWAKPEQTLRMGSGDGEDLAFLLASLLKFHTDEVDTDNGDLVYVQCGFFEPSNQDLHFWVYWGEDTLFFGGWQLDATSGEMGLIFPPGLGTLWLTDDHVFGFLPGYYPLPAPAVGGFGKEDFSNISKPLGGGFGDAMNNYAWAMTEFDGDVYVGTGRNTGYIMFLGFWPGDVPEGIVTQFADPTGGYAEYLQFLEDMQAEIWRYRDGNWELVHQAEPVMMPNPQPPPAYMPFPEGVGYRIMATFNGAIYAGIAGFGGASNRLILTSPSGDPGTWVPANHTGLEGRDTRSMTVHNGKLYVGTSIGDPARAAIFASADPANDGWTKVADFTGTTNEDTLSLKSFNGYLYVSTEGGFTDTAHGFEVWRSTVEDPTNPDVLAGGDWKQIVNDGAGDSRNFWGASTEVLDDHLYVGSISLPLVGEFLEETFNGFELIRVDKDDNWELVIGNRPEFVGVPNSTTAERGIPISGLPAGFGNPLNFYCWSLQEYDGVLYLGTLDLTSLLYCIPLEGMEQWRELIAPFAGADLWKTSDGITWEQVSPDGFGNPHNYGLRNMVSGSLYIGTANPFVGQGCEILVAPPSIPLATGWNTFSVPIDIGPDDNTLDDLATMAGLDIEIAYYFDGPTQTWGLAEGDYVMEPCDAIYIKMNEAGSVPIYPNPNPTVPAKDMYAGWNLVGSAFITETDEMPVDQALISLYYAQGELSPWGYTQVISPGLNQPRWVYNRDGTVENMLLGRGYLVAMDNADEYLGQTYTPVPWGP